MNKIVTSREELLKAAKEIVYEQGMEQLNMRELAHKCGVSVGSVYNYFPSKSNLLFVVVEDFWKSVFHSDICKVDTEISFLEFFELVYDRLSTHLEKFKTVYYGQLSLLSSAEKESGKKMEKRYFSHMEQGFLHILEQDKAISPKIWTDTFTKQQFVNFLFSNMITALSRNKTDCTYLKEIIRRLLYDL